MGGQDNLAGSLAQFGIGSVAGGAGLAVGAEGLAYRAVEHVVAPSSQQNIVFGTSPNSVSHTIRHVIDDGLSPTQVIDAITGHLTPNLPLTPMGAPFNGSVQVQGLTVTYVARGISPDIANVGRITTNLHELIP